MRRQLVLAVTFGLFLLSCDQGSSDEKSVILEEDRQDMPCDSAEATLAVKGMMCEIGCVNTVRKKLFDLTHVDTVVIDFQDGREINWARVKYDPRSLSAKSIVQQVEAIGDGMYPVESARVWRSMQCEE